MTLATRVVREAFVSYAGVRWAVEEASAQPGARSHALLLVHGAIANLRAWDGFLEELDREQRCDGAESRAPLGAVTLDLPCHGRTEGGELDFELCAAGIVAIADSLALDHPFLVGHSFGGLAAAAAAARAPDRFGGVMVLDPYLSNAASRGHHERLEDRQSDAAAAGWPFLDSPNLDRAIESFFAITGIRGERVPGWTRILQRGYRPSPRGEGVTFRPRQQDNLQAIAANWAFDVDAAYDAIVAPLAIVLAVGDLDGSFDQRAADARRPAATAIEARRRAIGSAGPARATEVIELACPHDVPGTEPAALASAVVNWVSRTCIHMGSTVHTPG